MCRDIFGAQPIQNGLAGCPSFDIQFALVKARLDVLNRDWDSFREFADFLVIAFAG